MGKLAKRLVQPLRARDDDSASEPYSDELGGSSRSPSLLSTASAADGQEDDVGSDEGDGEGEDDDDEAQEEDVDVKEQISKVSFGALAKAQDAFIKANGGDTGRKRKRGEKESQEQEDKLELLRQRLRELREGKDRSATATTTRKGAISTSQKKGAARSAESDEDTSGDSDSDASSADEGPAKRKSKHAPASQSATHQVSRHRAAIAVPKRHIRDPRFDKITGPPPDENALSKKYSFLNDYRASEIAELKTTLKTKKNPTTSKKLSSDEVDRLKDELKIMQDKEREIKRREQDQEVLRGHKKKEREAVKEGKQPFFLKKSEQKKLALVDRFEKMKPKQRDKAIERRRKKVTGRERRNMPDFRRGAEA